MAKLDYNNFKEAILKDFENQTAGIENELTKIINQKFSDIKLNPTQLRRAVKDVISVATRDLKLDVVDKIDLSQFIDTDPESLQKALKSQKEAVEKSIKELNEAIKNKVSGNALSDLQHKAQIEAEQYIGAFRTALQKGVKLDGIGLDKTSLTGLQNTLTDMGVIAKETVDKVNGYLSQIGVNVNSEKILDKVKNQLTSEDFAGILDSASMKRGAAMAQQSFDAIAKGAGEAKAAVTDLGNAYDVATGQLQDFAGAQEQLSDSFRNVEGVRQMADAMGEYAERVGAAMGVAGGENTTVAAPIVQAQEDIKKASSGTADAMVNDNQKEAEGLRVVERTAEETAARIAELKDELKRYITINGFHQSPFMDFEFEKNVELAQKFKHSLAELSSLDSSITIDSLLKEAEQDFKRLDGAAKNFDQTLKDIRKGTREWSFNKLLNDVDGFAKKLNELVAIYDKLMQHNNYDPKEALHLEAQIHGMLSAQHQLFEQGVSVNTYDGYFQAIQSKLNQVTQEYQDRFWEAMANGGNLMSRNDLKYAVEHQLGVKDVSFDLERAQKYLSILQNIQEVLSYDGGKGAENYYSRQLESNLTIAKELEDRLANTPKADRESDPTWVQNQYQIITKYLQQAEEYKRKLAEVKGELYEINQIKLEDVTARLQTQMGETPTDVTNVVAEEEQKKGAIEQTNNAYREQGEVRKEAESGTTTGVEGEERKAQAAEHTAAEEEKVNDLLRQGNELRQQTTGNTEAESSKMKPLEEELFTVNQLLDAIIRKFGVEGGVATSFAQNGKNDLEEVRQALESIDKILAGIGNKKININLGSLKNLKESDITTKLAALKESLQGMPDKTVNINLSSLKDFANSDIESKLATLKTALTDFPEAKVNINLQSIKDFETSDITAKVTALKNALVDFPEKTISVNLGNLKDFAVDDLTTKLTTLRDILGQFNEKKIVINLKSLKEIGVDELITKLTTLKNLVAQFPDKKIGVNLGSLSKIKVEEITEKLQALRVQVEQFPDKQIRVNLSSLKDLKPEDITARLQALKAELDKIGDRKISINLGGLQETKTEDIRTKLTALISTLKEFEDVEGVDLKGVNSLNKLLQLDVDPATLAKKFEDLAKAIRDFADQLRAIPDINTGFIASINNLIANGDKLANLATLIKAKQSDIDKVQNAVGTTNTDTRKLKTIEDVTAALAKEREEVDKLVDAFNAADRDTQLDMLSDIEKAQQSVAALEEKLDGLKQKQTEATLPKASDYSNALKYAKEYWQIKLKGNNATEEELTKLKVIEAEWDLLNSKVGEVTAKLEAQGRSTKSVSEFVAMYANNAGSGLQQYIKQETGIADPYKYLSESIIPNTSKYTSDVIKEATRLQSVFDKANIKHLIDTGAIKEINDAIASLKALKTEAASMEGKLVKSIKITGLIDEISKYKNTFSGLSRDTIGELDKYIRQLQDGLKNGMSVAKFNEVANAINGIKTRAREAGEETKSFWTRLGEQVQHTNEKMIGMYLSFYRIIGYIRQATSAVIELDSALTELRKITDISVERLNQSFQTSVETAKAMGSTIDAVISQTSDWSRLGYSIEDAEKLAKVSTLFQTVGDNMTAESASKAMISTLKGFDMAADEAMSVVDKYTEVANNFSIDTAGGEFPSPTYIVIYMYEDNYNGQRVIGHQRP